MSYLIQSFTSKDSISREDFAVTLYKGLVQKSQEAFEDAFDLFNSSGTGTMTQAELQGALQKLNEQVTEEEAAEMLQLASTRAVCTRGAAFSTARLAHKTPLAQRVLRANFQLSCSR